MSAQSLQNKSLQLAELIISNEKYQDSAGYVASSSTFNSSLTSCALSVPSIDLGSVILTADGSELLVNGQPISGGGGIVSITAGTGINITGTTEPTISTIMNPADYSTTAEANALYQPIGGTNLPTIVTLPANTAILPINVTQFVLGYDAQNLIIPPAGTYLFTMSFSMESYIDANIGGKIITASANLVYYVNSIYKLILTPIQTVTNGINPIRIQASALLVCDGVSQIQCNVTINDVSGGANGFIVFGPEPNEPPNLQFIKIG